MHPGSRVELEVLRECAGHGVLADLRIPAPVGLISPVTDKPLSRPLLFSISHTFIKPVVAAQDDLADLAAHTAREVRFVVETHTSRG